MSSLILSFLEPYLSTELGVVLVDQKIEYYEIIFQLKILIFYLCVLKSRMSNFKLALRFVKSSEGGCAFSISLLVVWDELAALFEPSLAVGEGGEVQPRQLSGLGIE